MSHQRICQLKIRVTPSEYLALLAIAERYNLGRNGATSAAAASVVVSSFAKLRVSALPEALTALKSHQKASLGGFKQTP